MKKYGGRSSQRSSIQRTNLSKMLMGNPKSKQKTQVVNMQMQMQINKKVNGETKNEVKCNNFFSKKKAVFELEKTNKTVKKMVTGYSKEDKETSLERKANKERDKEKNIFSKNKNFSKMNINFGLVKLSQLRKSQGNSKVDLLDYRSKAVYKKAEYTPSESKIIKTQNFIQSLSQLHFFEKFENENQVQKSHLFKLKWAEYDLPEISEDLKFLKIIGEGSFAKVYIAHLIKENNKKVAVKVIKKSSVKKEMYKKLVEQEIKILSTLKHPTICELITIKEDNKRVKNVFSDFQIYIIMEIGGKNTLYCTTKMTPFKRIQENKAKLICKQIVYGLAYIHSQGYCHRDIKLTNILVDENFKAKIIDFGFASKAEKPLKILCGTKSYMAPELIKKQQYDGKKVDIWALGVLLYMLLVGKYPFGSTFFIGF